MTPDPKMSGESFDRPESAEAERLLDDIAAHGPCAGKYCNEIFMLVESALTKAREEGRAEERERKT